MAVSRNPPIAREKEAANGIAWFLEVEDHSGSRILGKLLLLFRNCHLLIAKCQKWQNLKSRFLAERQQLANQQSAISGVAAPGAQFIKDR